MSPNTLPDSAPGHGITTKGKYACYADTPDSIDFTGKNTISSQYFTAEAETAQFEAKRKESEDDNKPSPMTPPKKPDLDKVLKFCATTPKSAPSPPLRRGDVYCLSSFARRVEQWYKEETARQLMQRSREAAAVGRRRQPSRAAKGTLEPGDYVLHQDELDLILPASAATPNPHPPPDSKKENSLKTPTHETRRLLTPPADEEVDEDHADSPKPKGESESPNQPRSPSPEARLRDFIARVSKVIHTKDQELRAHHDREGGIRHACAVGDAGWSCVDEQYCGHGLVDRCVAWIPKAKAHLRARVRFEMEEFFSSSASTLGHDHECLQIFSTRANNNTPERLAELKKARAATLRAETMRRMADIEARLESAGGEVAIEAEMLESPTLGKWPMESQGFPREDLGSQKVDVAGLAFAVDVCIGETRFLML